MSQARFLLGIWVGAVAASIAFALWMTWRPRPRQAQTLLGHFRYPVADASLLIPAGPVGEILLQPKAAKAFQGMQKGAREAGILLVPVSGFRTLTHQQRLFFEGAAGQSESVVERARTCAPPGYSEHHTGYSLDVGDGAHTDAHLELKFKDTKAFRWLKQNAARYHFEMSFPRNNRQQVAYEPWHWRYVGDQKSFRTFYYARLKP